MSRAHVEHRPVMSSSRSSERVNDPKYCLEQLRASGLPVCRRLAAELHDLLSLDDPLIAGPLDPEALLVWYAKLQGPVGTPYSRGIFELRLRYPENYPFKPPVVEFITPCYHPNITLDSGKICISILAADWSPLLNTKAILLSLSSLLSEPNMDDPVNMDALDAFEKSPKLFEEKARDWTERYATAA